MTTVNSKGGGTLSNALEVDEVVFAYGRGFQLGPVSFVIEGPGVTALMGPNGAGKSTLTRLLSGVAAVRSGHVRLAGQVVSTGHSGRAAKARMGYVPQSMSFPSRARVVEVLYHAAWLRGVPAGRREDAVEKALQVVNLGDRATDKVGSLSGGMVRRLAVAQAVVHEPAVLLLDEPTTGLDPQQRLTMREYILELGKRTAVLMATHLAEDVQATATDVVVIGQGKVFYDGDLSLFMQRALPEERGLSPLESALVQTLGPHYDDAR